MFQKIHMNLHKKRKYISQKIKAYISDLKNKNKTIMSTAAVIEFIVTFPISRLIYERVIAYKSINNISVTEKCSLKTLISHFF